METKPCLNPKCDYNIPVIRPHIHVITSNGSYIRYIIEKPKLKINNIGDDNADTWR